MPKNKIEDLRNLMFETIERLLDDEDKGMDIHKAKAISAVGRVIVDSAKVEVDFIQAVKNTPVKSTFMTAPEQQKFLPADEVADCKCGDAIYPADIDKSKELGLGYPRCAECLKVLPGNSRDLNGGGK